MKLMKGCGPVTGQVFVLKIVSYRIRTIKKNEGKYIQKGGSEGGNTDQGKA